MDIHLHPGLSYSVGGVDKEGPSVVLHVPTPRLGLQSKTLYGAGADAVLRILRGETEPEAEDVLLMASLGMLVPFALKSCAMEFSAKDVNLDGSSHVAGSASLELNPEMTLGNDGLIKVGGTQGVSFEVRVPDEWRAKLAAPGGAGLRTLSPQQQAALQQLQLVAPVGDFAKRINARRLANANCVSDLMNKRFHNFTELIPLAWRRFLSSYFRMRCSRGEFRRNDGQSDRFFAHNDPVAVSVLHGCLAWACEVFGRPLSPAYVYFAGYEPGAILAPHRDRRQCEYSVSVLLDYEIAGQLQAVSEWPLCFGEPQSVIMQAPGDAAAYYGCELIHSRPVLANGHRSFHLFLHYVDPGFSEERD